MTIRVAFSVPGHCAAAVTIIANAASGNPTESVTLIGPNGSYDGAVYDTQAIRVDEITTQEYNERTGVGATPSPLDAAAEEEAAAVAARESNDREVPVGPGEEDDEDDDGI